MTANTNPIYALTPNIGFNSYVVTANTTTDLTSGTIYLLYTAGSNGSYLERICFKPTPGGSTTGTVGRIWLNNGSTTGTATNNILFDDIDLPLTATSSTNAVYGSSRRYDLRLPASWRVYLTIHTGSANGWAVTAIGGDY